MSVAKEFVKLSWGGGEDIDPLTNLRLQKLLYYAQGWSLVTREAQLFPEELHAWKWGPVVPAVYARFSDRSDVIKLDELEGEPELSSEEAALVRRVWEGYSKFSASGLANKTHRESPYRNAWQDPEDATGKATIRLEDMEEFFGSEEMPDGLLAYQRELEEREQEAAARIASRPPIDTDRFRAIAKRQAEAAHSG